MLVIRLARKGRRNHPTFRVVLQEKEWAPSSTVIEILGHVNPHTNPRTVVLKKERIEYWMSKGAQPSDMMHNMLVDAGIVSGKKKRVVYGKGEPVKAEAGTAAPTATPAAA